MKTLIAIPCMDQVPTMFCQSLALLKKVGECTLAMQTGSLVYSSREQLTVKAAKADADYVLWLDSDMVFAPDLLERMLATLEAGKYDILSGVYYRRVAPYTPVLFETLEINENGDAKYTEYKEIPDGIFEAAGCGFGCVLMRSDVFLDVQYRFGHMFTPIGKNGEDVSFCWRARQCGFKIYCDPSIKLGHVSYQMITADMYKAYTAAK